jgi:hypothetical protein
MENLIKYGLFIYLIINFALTFVLPNYKIWKSKGIFAITFSNKDSAHDYIGKVFKTLLLITLLIGAINAFYTEGVKYLLPIWYLDILYLQVQGSMILLVALVWIMVARLHTVCTLVKCARKVFEPPLTLYPLSHSLAR